MAKIIGPVWTLNQRAANKGIARYNREGVEVYRIENKNQTSIKLFHYGTLIAWLLDGEVHYVYGESISDSDALYTFMREYGKDVFFGYRWKNGGFYSMGADNKKVFLDNCHDEYDFADRIQDFA